MKCHNRNRRERHREAMHVARVLRQAFPDYDVAPDGKRKLERQRLTSRMVNRRIGAWSLVMLRSLPGLTR